MNIPLHQVIKRHWKSIVLFWVTNWKLVHKFRQIILYAALEEKYNQDKKFQNTENLHNMKKWFIHGMKLQDLEFRLENQEVE